MPNNTLYTKKGTLILEVKSTGGMTQQLENGKQGFHFKAPFTLDF